MSDRRRLVVEADGGSRGNPGVAGYGALVRDPESGAVLAERAEPLGIASNNVAEYQGLIAGLEAAHEIEPGADVEARMDSKLVVEQMSGRWKIKHEEMRRLALRAREVVRDIEASGGSVRYTWVPRERNGPADALSNLAMDGKTVHRDLREDDEEHEDTARLPARLLLVRHGTTDAVEEGLLDGRRGPDHHLNPAGRRQAEAAARAAAELTKDAPVRVVTSSMARAVETGAIIATALGQDAEVDPDWDEQDFGAWDGRSVHEIVDSDPGTADRWRRDPTWAPPGGESHEDLVHRVRRALERVRARGGTTVAVCHRAPILVVLEQVLGTTSERTLRLAIAPGSLTAVEFGPDDAVVAFTNRT